MVTINIQKKDLHLLIIAAVFLIGTGIVVAYTQPGETANPIVHGHTADEIANLPVASAGGGVFNRWGNSNCPTGTELLYSGMAFNKYNGGFSNFGDTLCIKAGDPGPSTTYVEAGDMLYPLATGATGSGNIPPGITGGKEIKCSACYSQKPVFEIFGTNNCPSGWSVVYSGYEMGAHAYNTQTDRHCVDNINFDSGINTYAVSHAFWYGSFIQETGDSTNYPSLKYIKCAVCSKQ